MGEDALRLSELSGEPRRLAEQLFGGGTVEINRATIPFLSGISQRLIGRCTGAIDPSDRALLLRFGVSGASNLIFGGDYSNSDLRKGMGSLGSNVTLTAIGNKVGDTLRCTKSEAGRVAGLIARSVRANEKAGVFMPSCQSSFTRQQCSCLAKIAAGVIPDIQRRRYHRGLIKEMIGRNPLLGFQVGLVCQITRY